MEYDQETKRVLKRTEELQVEVYSGKKPKPGIQQVPSLEDAQIMFGFGGLPRILVWVSPQYNLKIPGVQKPERMNQFAEVKIVNLDGYTVCYQVCYGYDDKLPWQIGRLEDAWQAANELKEELEKDDNRVVKAWKFTRDTWDDDWRTLERYQEDADKLRGVR